MKVTRILIALAIVGGVVLALFHREAIHNWMQQSITELTVVELIGLGYFTAWIGSSLTRATDTNRYKRK